MIKQEEKRQSLFYVKKQKDIFSCFEQRKIENSYKTITINKATKGREERGKKVNKKKTKKQASFKRKTNLKKQR